MTYDQDPKAKQTEDRYARLAREARAQPDYVPEFPPSRLIDDSVEGTARAAAQIKHGYYGW